MRVLLVEDDAMIGAALMERLEDDAYAVDELVRHLGSRLRIMSSLQTSTGTTVRAAIPTASENSSAEGAAAP